MLGSQITNYSFEATNASHSTLIPGQDWCQRKVKISGKDKAHQINGAS